MYASKITVAAAIFFSLAFAAPTGLPEKRQDLVSVILDGTPESNWQQTYQCRSGANSLAQADTDAALQALKDWAGNSRTLDSHDSNQYVPVSGLLAECGCGVGHRC
jgi:hypothetical protein